MTIARFSRDLTLLFYGYSREGAAIHEGVRDSFWLQGMMGGIKGQIDCIRESSEVDDTPDRKRIDVPVLILHGDDQIVPIGVSGLMAARIIPGAILKIYKGGDHGLPSTDQDAFNADLLAVLQGQPVEGAQQQQRSHEDA